METRIRTKDRGGRWAVESPDNLQPGGLFVDDASAALATDLYELTMAAAYFEGGEDAQATFELFIRKLPEKRSFLVAAGLQQVVHYLQNLHFTPDSIAYVRQSPAFGHVRSDFFDYLEKLRFSGDVWALPEGTIFFSGEPVLRVTAPIIQAQIVETYLLSLCNFQISVASKAARVVLAAGSKKIIEFGTRRAHGPQAGVLAARASYVGGCSGTSNVLAARRTGIPAYGTMAHSYVMSFNREIDAFAQYQSVFPESTILLVDTYDSVAAVQKAVAAGIPFQGVRLDSGDLLRLSRRIRSLLDASGLRHVQILASGDLDEYRIRDLLRGGAPIDAFGVGTELSTSRDEPALAGVYKLVSMQRHRRILPRVKLSVQKRTLPGSKQIFRVRNKHGVFAWDNLCLEGEAGPADSEPLLIPVMKSGRLVAPLPDLDASRRLAQEQVQKLPERFRKLEPAGRYPVRISPRLRQLRDSLTRVNR